jgi:hypothetical protein
MGAVTRELVPRQLILACLLYAVLKQKRKRHPIKEGVLPTSARSDRGSRSQVRKSLQQLSTCKILGEKSMYATAPMSLCDVMVDASSDAPFKEFGPGLVEVHAMLCFACVR